MDASLFRLPTQPNLFAGQKQLVELRTEPRHSTRPAEDSRFPGWAAPFSDGHLVTDYRTHCQLNIPVEAQEKTRIWLQQNADSVLIQARQRMAEATGAVYGVDMTTEPPPAMLVKCTAAGCQRMATQESQGIGVARADTPCPDLFMTWKPDSLMPAPCPRVGGTGREEGGRNTRRG
jgi:hypothetical protein